MTGVVPEGVIPWQGPEGWWNRASGQLSSNSPSLRVSMWRLRALAISSRNLVWVRNHSRPALLPMVRLWSAASSRRWKAASAGAAESPLIR